MAPAPTPATPILSIEDLRLDFRTLAGPVHALRNISIAVPKGAIVGIVGESGSGKSTLALAIMRLMAANAVVAGGRIVFDGRDLLSAGETEMRDLRGQRISMVFQDPMTSLNPVRTIGQQMADIQHREPGQAAAKRARSLAVLTQVGIPDPERQLGRYPHEFSGGMRQRVSIAMSLLLRPEILIADEVTTALDVTMEAQILHLLRQLQKETGSTILFISHNLGAVAELCDRVVVLYAGEVVEDGSVYDIFARPQHPYTKALLACDPARISTATRTLPVIEGDVPNLRHPPAGCVFQPRCPVAIDACRTTRPPDVTTEPGHSARCHLLARTP
ncbi:MAG: ABC transporter ATP-binding protein [Hyphomicrobiaceae bacterium]